MARRRMYLFEHAYVDFLKKLKNVGKFIINICKIIWDWFFIDRVKFFIEILLLIMIVLVGIIVGIFYVNDQQQGAGFSINSIIGFVIIFVLVALILGGWKDLLKMFTLFFSACLAVSTIILFFSCNISHLLYFIIITHHFIYFVFSSNPFMCDNKSIIT